MTARCLVCDRPIPEGSRVDARYCSPAHKQRAYRDRASTAATPAVDVMAPSDTPSHRTAPEGVTQAAPAAISDPSTKENPMPTTYDLPTLLARFGLTGLPTWTEDQRFVELQAKTVEFDRDRRRLETELPSMAARNAELAARLEDAEADVLAGLVDQRALTAARQAMAESAVALTEAQTKLRTVKAARERVADAQEIIGDRAMQDTETALGPIYQAAHEDLLTALRVASAAAEVVFLVHDHAENEFAATGGRRSARGVYHQSAAGLVAEPRWSAELGLAGQHQKRGAENPTFLERYSSEVERGELVLPAPAPPPPKSTAARSAPAAIRRFVEGWQGDPS